MKTVLFLSVSLDGLIADKDGIPLFPEGAWQDWCSLVNDADNVIAGRSSFEQLKNEEMASVLSPSHRIVLSSRSLDLADSGWQRAKSSSEALDILKNKGVDEAIIGGGRAVAYSFMREKLIDEILIDLQPVAFGVGTPVFGDVLDLTELKLIDSRSLNENALRLRYQVLRDGIESHGKSTGPEINGAASSSAPLILLFFMLTYIRQKCRFFRFFLQS